MFYDRFEQLCNEKGVKPTRAALDMGLSKSTPTIWKKKGASPSGETLDKVSRYFRVSIDYLAGKTDIRSPLVSEVAKMWGTSPEEIYDSSGDMIEEIEEKAKNTPEIRNNALKRVMDMYYDQGFNDGKVAAQKEPATTEGDGLTKEQNELIEVVSKLTPTQSAMAKDIILRIFDEQGEGL